MPRSRTHTLVSILARVGVAYAVVFIVWLFVAPFYHMMLARVAGILIPIVGKADVQRVWIEDKDDTSAGVGAHFKVRFKGRDPAREQSGGGLVAVDSETVVEIRQFGYPIITFLALAFGVLPPRRWRDWRRILLGSGIIFVIYAVWVLVEVYQYAANLDIAFLRESLIAQVFPPRLYQRFRVPLITYLGQVIPIAVYGTFYLRDLLSLHRGPTEAYEGNRKRSAGRPED